MVYQPKKFKATLKPNITYWIKNKYVIAGSLFMVWMLFFDPKDWPSIFEKRARLKELQKNEKHIDNQIVETKNELFLLKSSAQTIEKYAREKYFMKKDNEDLFIVNNPLNTE